METEMGEKGRNAQRRPAIIAAKTEEPLSVQSAAWVRAERGRCAPATLFRRSGGAFWHDAPTAAHRDPATRLALCSPLSRNGVGEGMPSAFLSIA